MTSFVQSIGDDRSLAVSIDPRGIMAVTRQAPKISYFWTRDFLFLAFQQHRSRWLRAKGTKFGRGNGIKVPKINEGSSGAPGPLEVAYRVLPRERRALNRRRRPAGRP